MASTAAGSDVPDPDVFDTPSVEAPEATPDTAPDAYLLDATLPHDAANALEVIASDLGPKDVPMPPDVSKPVDVPKDLFAPDLALVTYDAGPVPEAGSPCTEKGRRRCVKPSDQLAAGPEILVCDGPEGALTWVPSLCPGQPYTKPGPCQDTQIDFACQENPLGGQCCPRNKMVATGDSNELRFCDTPGLSTCISSGGQRTCVPGESIEPEYTTLQLPCFVVAPGCLYEYALQCLKMGKDGEMTGACKPDLDPSTPPKCPDGTVQIP